MSRVSVAFRRGLAIGILGSIAFASWGCGGRAEGDVPVVSGSAGSNRPATKSDEKVRPERLTLDSKAFEDGGLSVASEYTGRLPDPRGPAQLREAIAGRGRLGLSVVQAQIDQAELSPDAPREKRVELSRLYYKLAQLAMYEGDFDRADAALIQAREVGAKAGVPEAFLDDLTVLRGIVSLRQGEVDNCILCLGPSSCIFPIAPEAAHRRKEGSRGAVARFTEYLEKRPGDLRVRWLLNLAYMTLDEYPGRVPKRFLIPIDAYQSKRRFARFENVAGPAGLTARGPNLAGGSVYDDFTGDGRPDLLTTSLDVDHGATLMVNRGDGTFEDRSTSAGLDDQVHALNVTRADIDNDGDLDALLLRGGWDVPMRMTLLRNAGDGTFADATEAAGLAEPIATEAAAFGDYDDDGLVDLFVCGEYYPPGGSGTGVKPDPRNRCRLYRNRGAGRFEEVGAKAGVAAELCSKGCAWGDYDGDGRLDLFVSNFVGDCRLFHNEGDGTFRDTAGELGVKSPEHGFACWFWDYDNDGRLDLYINDYSTSLAATAALALGEKIGGRSRPRLYRNVGREGFRDVAAETGLDRAVMPMGCNFGDIDNDGYLDVYLGTGAMSYEYLVPNVLWKNVEGERFEDVTTASGTGHLQKGHGVSFADFDDDGDLDLFVEAGGAVPGDRAYNLLFRNPLAGRTAVKLRLVGTKSNRAALGARIKATVQDGDGKTRAIHRTIGNNSSFGGNSLVELIGLGEKGVLAELEVSWPGGGSVQRFRNPPSAGLLEIVEGSAEPRVVTAEGKDGGR